MALVVAGSAGIGMGFSVFTALGVLLEPSGIGSGEAGLIGLIGETCAFFAGLLAVYIENKKSDIVKPFMFLLGASIVSMILWGAFIEFVVATYIISGFVGFFLCGYLGLMIRVSVIYNLNISEAITTVFFYFLTQIFTLIFIEIYIYIDLGGVPSIWAAAVLNTVVSVMILFLLVPFNRKQKAINQNLMEEMRI